MAEPEPLVLLPGMMCDARLWGPQVAAFEAERQVIVLPITEHDKVADLARAVLDAAPPRFALAGLSMGGIVAMQVIATAHDRVTRLALMDTNPKAEHPAYAKQREPQIARVLSGELHEVMRDEMKPNYLAPGPGREAVLDLCMEMAEALGPGVFVRQSRALQTRPDRQEALRHVRRPTLILCGEHDALCPIERHELMAGLVRGSVLEIVEDAGHLPTLERPEAVNAAMRDWLDA